MASQGSARARARIACALTLAALLALPAAAAARQQPRAAARGGDAKPYFDSRAAARTTAARAGTTVAAARPAARTTAARARLRRSLGTGGVLNVDPLTGTPRQLLRTDGALSASRGGDRVTIARDYLRANREASA